MREYVRERVHVLLCVFFLVYVKYMEFIVKNNLFCSVLFCSVLPSYQYMFCSLFVYVVFILPCVTLSIVMELQVYYKLYRLLPVYMGSYTRLELI